MTPLDDETLAREVRQLIARYEELRKRAPDLTGLHFAFEHGWVERGEVEAAERAWTAVAAAFRELDAQLDGWERDHTAAFRRLLESLRAQVAGRAAFPPALAPDVLRAFDRRLGRTAEPAQDLKWALWIALSELAR